MAEIKNSPETDIICYQCGKTVEIENKNNNESFSCKNEDCKKTIIMLDRTPLARYICLGKCRGNSIIISPPYEEIDNCIKCGSNEIFKVDNPTSSVKNHLPEKLMDAISYPWPKKRWHLEKRI